MLNKYLDYVYTSYGEVYVGVLIDEFHLSNFKIIIPSFNIQEYSKLSHTEKTIEKISEYGWVIAKNTIQKIINGENFDPSKNYTDIDSLNSESDNSIMFIIGAGASANCVYNTYKIDFQKDDFRPPLGISLFDNRFKDYFNRYKGVKQALPLLQGVQNVEEIFENEWKNISKENNDVVMKRHINIQYYIQELLKDVSFKTTENYYAKNLYARLANHLQKVYAASLSNPEKYKSKRNISFISFNQDTILDTFLSDQFNYDLKTINDYVNINNAPFYLFKPHGSWNWGWKFPDISLFKSNNPANWLFENNINFYKLYYEILGNHIDMIDWSTWGHEMSLNKNRLGKFTIDKSQIELINHENLNNYYPAILLPYRDKDEFTMPLRHFNNMIFNIFRNVETLIIIGWKGNEEAFNQQLFKNAQKINKIIIVDPFPDIIESNLKPLFTNQNLEKVYYKNFEDFVINGLENEIIN